MHTGKDDWWHVADWNAESKALFLRRARRSRAHKHTYYRGQAGLLRQQGSEHCVREALDLLDEIAAEKPEHHDHTHTHLMRALCLADLGMTQAALAAFEKSFDLLRRAPHVGHDGVLHFGMLVVGRGLQQLYGTVADRLREFPPLLTFPGDEYRFNAVLAILAESDGDSAEARVRAASALAAADKKSSQWARHRREGLVRVADADLHERLARLAKPSAAS